MIENERAARWILLGGMIAFCLLNVLEWMGGPKAEADGLVGAIGGYLLLKEGGRR